MPTGVYERKSKFSVGSVHETPNGPVVVLEYIPKKDGKHARAVVRFLNTGYVSNCQAANILQGKVQDKRAPTVHGVGYLGSDIRIPERGGGDIRRAYDMWTNMLRRSYYEGLSTVDPRWHNFTAFLNSLQDIPGYEAWERRENVHLDKDIRVPGNREYSLNTCAFVPASENIADAGRRRWAGVRSRSNTNG